MSALFSALLVRVFAGGLICTLVLILCGDGAHREIARAACACFMIALLLTPVRGVDISIDKLTQADRRETERAIEDALKQAGEQTKDVIAAQVCAYVRQKAQALGIACEAQVTPDVNEKGEYVLTHIIVRYDEGTDEGRLNALAELIALELGIPRERQELMPK